MKMIPHSWVFRGRFKGLAVIVQAPWDLQEPDGNVAGKHFIVSAFILTHGYNVTCV